MIWAISSLTFLLGLALGSALTVAALIFIWPAVEGDALDQLVEGEE